MNDAERLTRLEERYAHLQHHTLEQDKVMLELGEALVQMKKELGALRTQRGGGGEGEGDLPDERPPHY